MNDITLNYCKLFLKEMVMSCNKRVIFDLLIINIFSILLHLIYLCALIGDLYLEQKYNMCVVCITHTI